MADVIIDMQSRYKDTPVYDDADGDGPRFGLMVPPAEFVQADPTWRTHIVRQGEVGFLDLLVSRYYGPGYEKAWWSVGLINGIINVETDMYPGQRIMIPPASVAAAYRGRGPVT